jgi:hypothetical protein
MDRRAFLKLSAGAALAALLPGAAGASRQAEQRRQFESFLREMEARFRSMQVQPPLGPTPWTPVAPQSYTAPPATHDEYDFVLARVRFKEEGMPGRGTGPDIWNVRPGGDANLLRELATVIRCHVKPIQAFDWDPQYAYDGQLNAIVSLDDPELLREYPFLFMTGENNYQLTDAQKQNLQDYLKAGGFMLMDDCVVGNGGDFFYRSSYDVLEQLFGRGSVRQIPREHEVFHNLYDLREVGLPTLEYVHRRGFQGLRVTHGQNHGARGVFLRDRLAVFLSSTDLHCGWCDSHGVEWGPDGYRQTIQLGINLILYALTH